MSNSPDVSVVMSVYNGAAHLAESLDSILRQASVSLELILVNDGSTDGSADVADAYARRDERVKVFHQENAGLTRALVRGCAAATGRYIARQDVGDVSAEERLSLQQAALDANEELAFVSCWTEFCGPEWEFLYLSKGTGESTSPTYIISDTEKYGVTDGPAHHGSAMFRRDCYEQAGGYRPEFYYGQDWDLWFRLGEAGKFQMIERALYRARVMPNGISEEHKKRQEEIGQLALAALRQRRLSLSDRDCLEAAALIRPGSSGAGKSGSNAASYYFIGECLRRNGDGRSMKYFKKAIEARPLSITSWIRIAQLKIGLSMSGSNQ